MTAAAILPLLAGGPQHVDDLARALNVPRAELLPDLHRLHAARVIRQSALQGGCWSLFDAAPRATDPRPALETVRVYGGLRVVDGVEYDIVPLERVLTRQGWPSRGGCSLTAEAQLHRRRSQ